MTQEEIVKQLKEIQRYLDDRWEDWSDHALDLVEELIDELEKSNDAH